MLPRRSVFRRAFVAAALCAGIVPAAWSQAGTYPSRPVTVVVPFAAGGSVDAAARLVLQKLGERLHQTFVVDNVAGAAGTIGTQRVARAAADGYTLLFAVASPINVAPLVQPSIVRYDAFKDLAPVAAVATSPFVLVGSPKLAAAGTAEVLQLARAQAGRLNYGTDGVGTSMHLTTEIIKLRAGVDMQHVPYRSGPQVLTELSAGLLDLAVMPVALAQPFIRDGKVKAYGVTSRQRWPIAARRAGAGRDAGAAGRRRRVVVRPLRTRRHRCGDRLAAGAGTRHGARRRRPRAPHERGRSQAVAARPGAVRRAAAQGTRDARRGRRGGTHQGRMRPPRACCAAAAGRRRC